MAEGASYLHFNITNMITIWIIVAVGVAALGFVGSVWKNKKASS